MRYPTWSDYASGEHSDAPYLHRNLWAAWMPMFGATGSTLFDVGPRGYHAAANNRTNATDWATRQFSAAYFQEANATGRFIPPAASTLGGQEEATISCWVWLVATPATTAAIYQDTATALTGARFGLLWQNNGNIQFQMRDPYTQRSLAPLTSSVTTDTYGRWSHWAATYSASAGTIVLYRDGVAVRNSVNSNDIIRSTSVYGIGIGGRINSAAAEASNDVYIAEMRLWNRALNSEEVRELGNAPGTGFRRRNVLSRVAIAFAAQPQTVTVPVADLTASAVVPTIKLTAPVPVADLTALAVVPTYHLTVPVPVAELSATAVLPAVSSPVTVTVPVADATLSAVLPGVLSPVTVTVPVADLTATAILPSVSSPVTVTVPVATAAATAEQPDLVTTSVSFVTMPVAELLAEAILPKTNVTIPVPVATAAATAVTPETGGQVTVVVPVAIATCSAIYEIAGNHILDEVGQDTFDEDGLPLEDENEAAPNEIVVTVPVAICQCIAIPGQTVAGLETDFYADYEAWSATANASVSLTANYQTPTYNSWVRRVDTPSRGVQLK